MGEYHSIRAPAGYAPQVAVCFSGDDGSAMVAGAGHPLPVTVVRPSAGGEALVGTATSDVIAGPFVPTPGAPIWLTLAGSWIGTVAVQRSVDGGLTRRVLTAGGRPWGRFAGNVNEPIAEESFGGAPFYLAIAISDGVLSYEVRQ